MQRAAGWRLACKGGGAASSCEAPRQGAAPLIHNCRRPAMAKLACSSACTSEQLGMCARGGSQQLKCSESPPHLGCALKAAQSLLVNAHRGPICTGTKGTLQPGSPRKQQRGPCMKRYCLGASEPRPCGRWCRDLRKCSARRRTLCVIRGLPPHPPSRTGWLAPAWPLPSWLSQHTAGDAALVATALIPLHTRPARAAGLAPFLSKAADTMGALWCLSGAQEGGSGRTAARAGARQQQRPQGAAQLARRQSFATGLAPRGGGAAPEAPRGLAAVRSRRPRAPRSRCAAQQAARARGA